MRPLPLSTSLGMIGLLLICHDVVEYLDILLIANHAEFCASNHTLHPSQFRSRPLSHHPPPLSVSLTPLLPPSPPSLSHSVSISLDQYDFFPLSLYPTVKPSLFRSLSGSLFHSPSLSHTHTLSLFLSLSLSLTLTLTLTLSRALSLSLLSLSIARSPQWG